MWALSLEVHFFHPIPTVTSLMSMQATPFLWGPRLVLPHEEELVGIKSLPPFLRGSVEELWKRNTTSLTWFYSQFPCPPSFPIKNRVLRWRKNQAITKPSSDCKILIKQGLNWNAGWVKRHRSWPKNMTIVGSSWLRNMRRQWARMTQERKCHLSRSLFYGASLSWFDKATALVCFFCSSLLLCEWKVLATALCNRVKMSNLPLQHPSQRDHWIQVPWAVQLIQLELPPPLMPLLPDIPFVDTPPVGHPFPGFIASPTPKNWDLSSSSSLGDHHTKRTHLSPKEAEVTSEHQLCSGVMKTHVQIGTRGWILALNSEGRNLPVYPSSTN